MRGTFDWPQGSSGKLFDDLGKGEQDVTQTIFSRGGELLTLSGDTVKYKKQHFGEFLKLTNTSSVKEDLVESSSIYLAEVSTCHSSSVAS